MTNLQKEIPNPYIIPSSYRMEHYPPLDSGLSNKSFAYFKDTSIEEIGELWKRTLSLSLGLAHPILLYVHWPFCSSYCSFCRFGMESPSHHKEQELVLNSLREEMGRLKDTFKEISFPSLYIGGGTPTFMTDAMLENFLSAIRGNFKLAPGAQIHVDASPATLTESKLKILIRHGINRITLGIQTFDAQVLGRIDRRGQDEQKVRTLFALIKKFPDLFIDTDMMIGLEGQKDSIFIKDFSQILTLSPHSIHLYPFADDERTLWKKRGKKVDRNQKDQNSYLLNLADCMARKAGYVTGYEDWENLRQNPWETRHEALWRDFRASILGIGYGALSHIFGAAWYYHPKPPSKGVSTDAIPPIKMLEFDVEEEMRGYIIESIMRNNKISRAAFHSLFHHDVSECAPVSYILEGFEKRGLMKVDSAALYWTGQDIVERSIQLQRLYSPKMTEALIQSTVDSGYCHVEGGTLLDHRIRTRQGHIDCRIYYRRSLFIDMKSHIA